MPIEDLEAYSLAQHDPTKTHDIKAMYGLDAPVFDDLDGSAEAGKGGVRIGLDASAVLTWQASRIEGADAIA